MWAALLDTCSVTRSFATGNASAGERAGGLVGRMQGTSILEDTYAWGDVSGDELLGGLVGRADNSSSITTSYSAGAVDDGTDVGGLVGYANIDATISDSDWDRESTGQESSAGQTDDFGLTTEQMQGGNASDNMTGFNFGDVWVQLAGYPILSWQPHQQEPGETFPVPVNSTWALVLMVLALLLMAAVSRQRMRS